MTSSTSSAIPSNAGATQPSSIEKASLTAPPTNTNESESAISQEDHLRKIFNDIRDLAASCAMHQATWSDECEDTNRPLIGLIGEILSTLSEETTVTPATCAQIQQIVNRYVVQQEESEKSQSDDDTLCELHVGSREAPVITTAVTSTTPDPVSAGEITDPKKLSTLLSGDYTVQHDGTIVTRKSSATGLGVHTRWHYLSPNLGESKNLRNGTVSVTVASATGQGRHVRWFQVPSAGISTTVPPAIGHANTTNSTVHTTVPSPTNTSTRKRSRANVIGVEVASEPPSPKKRRGPGTFPLSDASLNRKRKSKCRKEI